jgi:hypothetical protein
MKVGSSGEAVVPMVTNRDQRTSPPTAPGLGQFAGDAEGEGEDVLYR